MYGQASYRMTVSAAVHADTSKRVYIAGTVDTDMIGRPRSE